jgi:hypothetical protein
MKLLFQGELKTVVKQFDYDFQRCLLLPPPNLPPCSPNLYLLGSARPYWQQSLLDGAKVCLAQPGLRFGVVQHSSDPFRLGLHHIDFPEVVNLCVCGSVTFQQHLTDSSTALRGCDNIWYTYW